jgi:hypothetical protein
MLYTQVTQFSADRQPHSVIDCERLTVEQACGAVEAALSRLDPAYRPPS